MKNQRGILSIVASALVLGTPLAVSDELAFGVGANRDEADSANAAEELIVDFGSGHGCYVYHDASSWSFLSALDPRVLTTGDLDGDGAEEVIGVFDVGPGIRIYSASTGWTTLHRVGPELVVTGDLDGNGSDELIVDFGGGPGLGVYIYYNNSTWIRLHSLSPEVMSVGDLDGNGSDELIVDFGGGPGLGIYIFHNNETWSRLHSVSPEQIVTGDLDRNGRDELIVDFGDGPGLGLYVHFDDRRWSRLHGLSPEQMVVGDLGGNGRDELIVDFGAGPGLGLYVYYNSIGWFRLHGLSPRKLVAGDLDGNGREDLAVDFGDGPGLGLYAYFNDHSWSRLHGLGTQFIVAGNLDDVAPGCIWPNAVSSANSDPWIVMHHDEICGMEPRLLVLNFSNDTTMREAESKAQQLIEALAESSRWHGYSNAEAAGFLRYRLDRLVDLRDDPPVSTCDGNSTKYPRSGNPTFNFDYVQLYGETFAEYYGYPDPDDPQRFLTLAELVNRGMIHEVWFFANHGSCGAPYETIELKQYYDQEFLPDGYGVAGNGHDYNVPWIGRSLRITFINPHRGTGCAMENLGHALEGTRHYDAIPYYTKYFTEFAGFDLGTRHGLPFQSFYRFSGEDSNAYPDPSTLVSHYRGLDYRVDGYAAIGGNVHFTPNGRRHYDLVNPAEVDSTIKSWRLGNGPGGTDRVEAFHIDDFAAYSSLAPDCMGPWLVYWRQNMPGRGNLAVDDQDETMKNWWPFLFY